jgi:N-acetylglucosaminyldiphosphoundecaprenol N-acetyl-beta-D-mannosaminyltransferase
LLEILATETQAVDFDGICAHAVSLPEAVDLIARRAASGRGGFVLTPNLDHLALSRGNPEMARAYARAFLSLADGMPLVAASRALGLPIREKVSGSDLLAPLMERCAHDRLPVFFIGASAATCETASRRFRAAHPELLLAGYDASRFDLEADPATARDALRLARDSGARVILVCLPPVKQLMMSRFEDDYRPALAVGVGSSLAFYAGEVRRAPAWMSRVGLEWFHRLLQEPRRLWRRYLLEDPQALAVFLRMAARRARGRPLSRVCRLDTSPTASEPTASVRPRS